MTSKNSNRIKNFTLALFLSLCLALIGQIPFVNATAVFAAREVASESVAITNSDFDNSTSTMLQTSPSGWSQVGSSTGKSGIIDTQDSTFENSSRTTSYALKSTQNPHTAYTTLDNHVLMINAREKADSSIQNHTGFTSNSISLEKYSYYKLSVWALTENDASASIYVKGLSQETESAEYEYFSSNVWTEFRFYIITGNKAENIKIELWLGSETKSSLNAVFFDHLTLNKISGSYYYDEAGKAISDMKLASYTEEQISNQMKADRKTVTDLSTYTQSLISNQDFETGDFSNWKIIGTMPMTGNAKVISINNSASMQNLGLTYFGSNLSENTNYALLLYSMNDENTHIEYESDEFTVNPYEAYKITVSAKVSDSFTGNAYFKVQEQDDVENFYGEDDDFYTPMSASVSIKSNSTNKITNNYTTYTIYVKGHELFSTSLKLQLCLGSTDEQAKGYVVFDDIHFEKIDWSEFGSESTNSSSLELTTISNEPSVTNGAFNKASSLTKDFTYPVNPNGWTSSMEDENKSVCGIINTNTTLYNNFAKSKLNNVINPQNPASAGYVDSDVNNVLVMYNKLNAYQTITSSEISLSKQSYQRVSFDYKTTLQSLNTELLNVYILDDENNVIYADEGLHSEIWTNYSLLIRTTEYTNTIKLCLGLGTKDNKVTGFVFVDNVKFETDDTMTDEAYETYVDAHNTLDFTVSNFNFVSKVADDKGFFTAYRYDISSDNNAFGGIIDGENNVYGITNSENNKNAIKLMPAFRVDGKGTFTLTSKEKITLSTDKFYKVSVDIYTVFVNSSSDKDISYGAKFALTGLSDNFTEVVSNDKWTTYEMYIEVDEETTSSLVFGIENNSNEVIGKVFFDNFKFEEIEEEAYNNGVTLSASDETKLSLTVEEPEEEPEEKDEEDKSSDLTIWYVIPTLLLFAALILAVVAYYMKKVTIKKWERKKASEYDRNATLHRDVIRKEAEAQRDEQIKVVKKEIEDTQTEIARIEELHKENSKALKSTTTGISRAQEKDFKLYAKQHTALENKVQSLNDRIENMQLPEYLLSIQHKLILEKIKQERKIKDEQNKVKKEAKKQAKLAKKSK